MYPSTESYRDETRIYAHYNPYLKRILGLEAQNPYGKNVADILFGLASGDSNSDKKVTDSGDADTIYQQNNARLRELRRCWDEFETIDDKYLSNLSEANPRLAQLIQTMVMKRSYDKREESDASLNQEYLRLAEEIMARTNLHPSETEDIYLFVAGALEHVQITGEPDDYFSKSELDVKLLRLPKDVLVQYMLDRARFEVWLSSINSHDWIAIGGADNPLAEKEYKKLEKERAEQNEKEIARKLALEKEKHYLELSNSLQVRMQEILTLHDYLISESESVKYIDMSTTTGRWLHGRMKPKGQPYGVSAQGAELLVADWLRYLGELDVQLTRYTGDGGIDVKTQSLCVQVKNYDKSLVSSSETRDIFGTAVSENRIACIFTSSGLSKGSLQFAEKNKIIAVHYDSQKATLAPLNPAGARFLREGMYN